MSVKIFVSHSSKYRDIATSLKLSLLALESESHLDIRISEEMAGATDWRQWIEDNVRSADIFLLLYPHAAMEMGWCNYELGRFYVQDSRRPVVCIKNTDIAKPPPAFQPYQAYDADPAGLGKFIKELFVTGDLTGGRKLNADVDRPTSDFYLRGRDVASLLAKQFAEARVREHFYERRLVINVVHRDRDRIDAEASTIHGNAEGLNLLGLGEGVPARWAALQARLGENGAWLLELEQAIATVPTGALPPALSPFRCPGGIYIPLVVKAESADGLLRQLVLIFVPASAERLLPLLGWSFPKAMPDPVKYLLHLVRMMFRARWEILEPRYQEAKYKTPTPQRCAELAALVLADYAQMQHDSDADGQGGLDRFFAAFHKELRGEVAACGDEWMQCTGRLRDASAPSANELAELLKALLQNNARWLSLASRQFMHAVHDLA
ncbi:MAG: toll/interleukin-1 receptor domain-containing protein [Pseudomonadota bacterium]